MGIRHSNRICKRVQSWYSDFVLLLIEVVLLAHVVKDTTSLASLLLLRIEIRKDNALARCLLFVGQVQVERRLHLIVCSSHHAGNVQVRICGVLGEQDDMLLLQRTEEMLWCDGLVVVGLTRRAEEVRLGLRAAGLAAELSFKDNAVLAVGVEALHDALGAGLHSERRLRKGALACSFGGEHMRQGAACDDRSGHELQQLERLRGIGVCVGGRGHGEHVGMVDADEVGGILHDEVEQRGCVDVLGGNGVVHGVNDNEALLAVAHGLLDVGKDGSSSAIAPGGDIAHSRVEARALEGDDHDIDVAGESANDKLLEEGDGALVEVVQDQGER